MCGDLLPKSPAVPLQEMMEQQRQVRQSARAMGEP
jgi:hypothetical protein